MFSAHHAVGVLLFMGFWALDAASSSSPLSGSSPGEKWHWTRGKGRNIVFTALGVAGLAVGVHLYQIVVPDRRAIKDRHHYYSNWRLRLYASLPWNAVSRWAGGLASWRIPMNLREPLLGAFARTYSCRLDEAIDSDLKSYATFVQFFNRKIKPQLRPISSAPLVSPADGVVLHYGRVENGKIEYVKEHDYSIDEFLGPIHRDENKVLYQMEIYLAPGDYHGFHSPARWTAKMRRHHPGLLLSVRPTLLDRIPQLFCINERVVLNGYWRHGFFSVSAVAATNVGDVAIAADPEMRTNVRRRRKDNPEMTEKALHAPFMPGEWLGEFRLGSTIVLVFEAPPTIRFAVKAGDQLRYGQSLVIDGV